MLIMFGIGFTARCMAQVGMDDADSESFAWFGLDIPFLFRLNFRVHSFGKGYGSAHTLSGEKIYPCPWCQTLGRFKRKMIDTPKGVVIESCKLCHEDRYFKRQGSGFVPVNGSGAQWHHRQRFKDGPRQCGFDFYVIGGDPTLVFNWLCPAHSWTRPSTRNGIPWFRHIYINFKDLLLGQNDYKADVLHACEAFLELPEGRYPVKLSISQEVWTRKRFTFLKRRRLSGHIDCQIQQPDKYGDWDAIHAIGTDISDPLHAVGQTLERLTVKIIKERERQGGRGWKPRTDRGPQPIP